MNILPFDFFHVSLTLHMYSEAQADPTVAVEVVRHTHYTGLAVRIDLGKTLIFADGGRRQGGFTTYGRDFDISFIVRQWRLGNWPPDAPIAKQRDATHVT